MNDTDSLLHISRPAYSRSGRGHEWALVIGFLGIISLPAAFQSIGELRNGEYPQALQIFRHRPTASNLRAFEHDLEDSSRVAGAVRPWVQNLQYRFLGDAGEKALVGRDGWLFYRPGFTYLMERSVRSASNSPSANALSAIVDYREALAARGIRLLVMITPNKESIYPEYLSRRASPGEVIVANQTRQLLDGLRGAGVEVLDLFETYREIKQRLDPGPDRLYLARDSHWSPIGIAAAARSAADRLRALQWVTQGNADYAIRPMVVRRTGDVLRMLQVPDIERRATPEEIRCEQVVEGASGQAYRADPDSDILILGDSFLRIFQEDEPTGAGFIAHLARELRRPLTAVVNDGGASTLVRQELNRHPQWLANKTLVIWEFVERDIRFGTEGWQRVPLPSAAPVPPTEKVAMNRDR